MVWTLALSGPVFADKEAFVEACLSSSNLERAICECCAAKAEAELSPLGFEFLTASLQGDHAKTAQLRGQLQIPEAMKTGMFMVNAPKRCAEEIGP